MVRVQIVRRVVEPAVSILLGKMQRNSLDEDVLDSQA
jgi:hypothetical protein